MIQDKTRLPMCVCTIGMSLVHCAWQAEVCAERTAGWRFATSLLNEIEFCENSFCKAYFRFECSRLVHVLEHVVHCVERIA